MGYFKAGNIAQGSKFNRNVKKKKKRKNEKYQLFIFRFINWNGHLYRSFLLLIEKLKLLFTTSPFSLNHAHTHSYFILGLSSLSDIHARTHTTMNASGELRILEMLTAGAGDCTTDLLISGRPALPPEPQPPLQVSLPLRGSLYYSELSPLPLTWLCVRSRQHVSLSCSLSLASRFCSSCSCCFSSCRRRIALSSSLRSCCASSTR